MREGYNQRTAVCVAANAVCLDGDLWETMMGFKHGDDTLFTLCLC